MDTWHTYMVETKDNTRGTARKKKKKSHTNIAHIRAPPFFGFSLTRERHLTVWPPASLHNTQAYPCKQYKPTMRTALHVCVQ